MDEEQKEKSKEYSRKYRIVNRNEKERESSQMRQVRQVTITHFSHSSLMHLDFSSSKGVNLLNQIVDGTKIYVHMKKKKDNYGQEK